MPTSLGHEIRKISHFKQEKVGCMRSLRTWKQYTYTHTTLAEINMTMLMRSSSHAPWVWQEAHLKSLSYSMSLNSLSLSQSFIFKQECKLNGHDSFDPRSSSSWSPPPSIQDCPVCQTTNTTGVMYSQASYKEPLWLY